MSPILVILLLLGYFGILISISFVTSKTSTSSSFYLADKKSPWYLVAFGMIGASLSGVTFISIPGWVEAKSFAYMQIVLGYMVGYFVIAKVLMPLYYKLNLVSIYSYLKERFGASSHKTGAAFFLMSRIVGASLRLYLVVIVLQTFAFDELGVPFWCTVIISIALIWIYTFRSGMKTIIYTDTLQTFFMLLAVGVTIYILSKEMDASVFSLFDTALSSEYSQIFFIEDWRASNFFPKQFLSGVFIAITMTGLDQDMMQKNLSCKNLGEAQKNMLWFSVTLLVVNFIFLMLGALLFMYAYDIGLNIPENKDLLYPLLAKSHLGIVGAIIFLLGLIAAAYSSADSALTSLTTSFCKDFLSSSNDEVIPAKRRYSVHLGFSVILFITILVINAFNSKSAIDKLFELAGYTYGPLLGLFTYGIFTKLKVKDRWVPLICILSPCICYLLNSFSKELFFGYEFGYELLLLNGVLVFGGMFIVSEKQSNSG